MSIQANGAPRLLLAKLDVEGAELEALGVLMPLLSRISNLIIEVSPGEPRRVPYTCCALPALCTSDVSMAAPPRALPQDGGRYMQT